MTMVLLSLSCSVADGETIAIALRDALAVPVRQHPESVIGRNFDDAGTVECVAGALARVAIELEVPAEQVPQALEVATATRRRLPFRWRTTALLDGGRIV